MPWTLQGSWFYLDLAKLPCALHSAGNINSVAPNVILRLPGTDHTSNHWAVIDPCTNKQVSLLRQEGM